MRWKEIKKEFDKCIDKVDRLGYDKVYLLGIMTDKYNPEKMKMNFVICKSEQYQKDIEKIDKEKNKNELPWTMGTQLIRK